MAPLRIPCLRCQKRLKLRDAKHLGRKTKCPRCGHRFVLCVPGAAPDGDDAGTEPVTPSASVMPVESPTPAEPPSFDGLLINVEPEPVVARLNRVRTGGRGRRVVAGVVLLAVGAVIVAWLRWQQAASPRPNRGAASAVTDDSTDDEAVSAESHVSIVGPDRQRLGQQPQTDREPIRLLMVPSGGRVFVHLRPSVLWSDEARLSELRASLTQDVVTAMEASLRNIIDREPAALDEVLLVWILGARGTEPQVAAVVQLAEEERLSDLIEEFGGKPLDEFAQPKVYLGEERAVLIRDRRTLAFAPRELAAELAEWVDTPNDNTTDGILALLEETDRKRLLTVVFEPADIEQHLDVLFTEPTRGIAAHVTSWFAEQAETVAWSIDTGEEFSSEILLRGRSTKSSTSVAEGVAQEMERLPVDMANVVRVMNPQRAGFRRLIGRFPAMLEVFRMATVTAVGDRLVRLRTALPAKAGPNLALAAVLTWHESARSASGSHRSPTPAARDSRPSPQTVAERLRLPVDAEFNRTPLQEAMAYIADEIGLVIAIDGDALKDAGYTKNMPQTFDLGRVPASEAIRKIIQQYQEPGKQMVLVLNEEQQRATVLTRKFAEQRGWEPFNLSP